jgi:hypothetical protein
MHNDEMSNIYNKLEKMMEETRVAPSQDLILYVGKASHHFLP